MTDTAKPQAEKTDEDKQEEVFLYEGPLVKGSAKALNLSVPVTADIFLVINFVIILLAIVLPLARFMPRVMRNRARALDQDLESARKATSAAQARLSAIQNKLAGLDAEIAALHTQVDQESQADQLRIQASLKEESERIVAAAEQEIAVATAQARRGLRSFAAELAIEQASRQLVLTADADKSLIAEFSAELARGGKN